MLYRDSNGTTNKLVTGALHFSATVIVIILLITMNKCNSYRTMYKDTDNLYNSSLDTLHKYKNKLGEEVAKIETLSSENNELFTSLQFKDAYIQKLQNVVKRYEDDNKKLSSALFIANSTIVYFADSIKNLISGWEQPDSNSCFKYPTYKRAFDLTDCRTTGNVTLGLNTFSIDFKLQNEYEIVIGEERAGLFKKKQFAEITNKNKCTTTDAMRVYDKKEKKTNIWKPLGIGLGVGLLIAKIFL